MMIKRPLSANFGGNNLARCLQLFGALFLIGFFGCANRNNLTNIMHVDPIRCVDRSISSESTLEVDKFEFAQLDDPEPEGPTKKSVSLNESNSIINNPSTIATQRSVWAVLMDDQREFYSRRNVKPAVLLLSTTAILASTTMDQEFADWYQSDVSSHSLDGIADVSKLFGEQWPMVGLYLSASVTGRWLDVDPRLANWGDRSLRSMFVGVPPLLFLQKALGSSRPNDVPPSSTWDFWADANGASGHTFVGAVPFLVAAQLAERPRAKGTWFVLSTLPGWSRINDNDHYLSQVIVGWWLAYAATHSVERSDLLDCELTPALIGNSFGLEASWRR
jgi:membrane-associated phospholipid phosphatase